MKQEYGEISIFDIGKEEKRIRKPIRLIEFFAGYGSQALALKYLGVPFEHHKISEWAVPSIKAYKDLHFEDDKNDYSADMKIDEIKAYLCGRISQNYNVQMSEKQIKAMKEETARGIYSDMVAEHNLGSICLVHGSDLEIKDTEKYEYILTYSFPCFTGDSLVLTKRGYCQICDVIKGDEVLTHLNRYQKVETVKCTGEKPTIRLRTMATDEIRCTPEHRFYVREKINGEFGQPGWKQAQHLTGNDYVGIAINNEAIIPVWDGITFEWRDGRKPRRKNELLPLLKQKNFWWLMGRYVADGYIRTQGGIVICCGKKKAEEMEKHIDGLLNYSKVEERTVYKYHFPKKELELFAQRFGNGASNKEIIGDVINLPCDLLTSFLEGYMSGDGCYSQGKYKATTTSRKLAYGLSQIVHKCYKTPTGVYFSKRKPICMIEGRIVTQKNTYTVVWKTEKKKKDRAFYDEGYIWCPIRDITRGQIEKVYDLQVENDHSFTVQNAIVHNCQDLSNSGKRAGMKKGSGTRSGMLWEVERILNELNECGSEHLPQILLMENVLAVCGSGNIKVFAEWLDALEKLGYGNYYKILNAADYKIPQNRERCFMVSLLGDEMFEFPAKMPLELRLRDVLEKNVDEKYYLSDKAVESFIAHTEKMKEKGNGFKFEPTGGGGYAKSILTTAGSRPCDNYIDDKLLAEWRDSPDDKKPLCKSERGELRTEERRVERTRDNGADGIYLGQSDEFCRGGYKDIARAITTQGKNGVIEWETGNV